MSVKGKVVRVLN